MNTQTDVRLIAFENNQPVIRDILRILCHIEIMLSHVKSKGDDVKIGIFSPLLS